MLSPKKHRGELPEAGEVTPDLARQAQACWAEAARQQGIDLTDFDPSASLEQRLFWAKQHGLEIGCLLARHSTKLQHSTGDQVRDNCQAAAARRIYTPSEYICVDEAVSGRKQRRDGLVRLTMILERRLATVLLVFMFSRIFRTGYRGFGFIQESVVDLGLRAISVGQGIDTADEKTWRQMTYMYGIMDEMLLTTIAQHVKSGLSGLFRLGFVVGALTIGYTGKEVEGAPLTNRGKPRRVPAVDPKVAKLIRKHFRWIARGMPLAEGHRRWVRAGGPVDPRCKTGEMSYTAYRRMLSNPRYLGVWAFGRKRNRWNARLDYTQQVEQPEDEVIIVRSDELRIVSDKRFQAVQKRLEKNKTGSRGPSSGKQPQLWDLVTDCFVCAACSTPKIDYRMYQGGAHGVGMKCKRGNLCPARVIVNRKDAVLNVCQMLGDLLRHDADLIERTVARSGDVDANQNERLLDELAQARKRERVLLRKEDDLEELLGEGTEDDRAATKRKIRATRAQRSAAHMETERIAAEIEHGPKAITPEEVRTLLNDLPNLLANSTTDDENDEDDDQIYRAADVFRRLVGGRIAVIVELRPGRKKCNVRGRFTPQILCTVAEELGNSTAITGSESTPGEQTVWLREPPRLDAIALRVHELIDIESLSFRDAAKKLREEGIKVNSGNVWYSYHRWYEMQGLTAPDLPYNNGRPRKPK
ncbi:recombinase family protein [Lignipirellula cremea]|uniref:Recombinase n=1 Tax=Lignipirellula cremea TaxID=2528010 RepID=A0A518DRK2_9BACT|nr:recombinase family protein [Lignipirellula cremea]QDU94470.1 Recombinase [Lignipirellula cremea]